MISVVIPFHNAEDYIGEAINSVLAQTFPAEQIILINDSSTDHSLDVVSKFEGYVEIYNVSYRNAAKARNEALKYAKGEWLAFLDADDIWFPNHLKNFLDVLEKEDFVGYLTDFELSENLQPISSHFNRSIEPNNYAIKSDLEFLKWYNEKMAFTGMSACIVDKKRFDSIGGFDSSFNRRHDIEMWLRLINGESWAMSFNKTSAYRINVPNSISSNIYESKWFKHAAFIKNITLYDGVSIYDDILRKTASSLITSTILHNGSQFGENFNRNKKYLYNSDKLIFQIARYFPTIFSLLINFRRDLIK